MSLAQNLLIARLPKRAQARLIAAGITVPLTLGDILNEPGVATQHVYFPTDSFISLIAQVDDFKGLEVGMVGREGMLGSQLVLGVKTAPLRALVQGSGGCLRIPVADFQQVLDDDPVMRALLARYVYVLMAQTAVSAGCLHYHLIAPRLARWLLMSQDRAHSDCFHITHEFLAVMLGARRVGITVAAGDLQRRGLISYHRGEITVRDRSGLEASACSCYAADQRVYTGQFH